MNRCALTLLAFGTSLPLALALQSPGDGIPGVGELGGPSRVLDPAELEVWLRGRALFDQPFHKTRGVGAPNMNADSCRGCHQDPLLAGAGALELNVSRFANDNGGAGPFQNLPGGQGLFKLRPPFAAGREEYDPLTADLFEQRQTPALFGGGLIDSIPEVEILARQDPTDVDGDGILGVARQLTIGGLTEIGRFGWKAQVPTLRDFIKDAMGGELGITTPDDSRGFALLSDGDTVADPELGPSEVDDMAFFLSNLAPPPRTGSQDPQVLMGELLFGSVGCAKCHVPELAGALGPVPLFSDLLLHDVMAAGFRGMEEPGAGAGMYRTPPLWGVRHSAPYLHDGRAADLRAAVLAHDGEAAAVQQAFVALPTNDQDAIIAFLNDI